MSTSTTESTLTLKEKKLIKYFLKTLLSDISKIIIFYFLFFLFHMEKAFIISLCTLLLLRSFTGGLHFKKYLSCLLFSLLFFSVDLICIRLIPLNNSIVNVFLLLGIIAINLVGPMQSNKRPELSLKNRRINSLLASSIIMIHLLLYNLFPESFYLNCAIWTIILQTVQLIISKGVIIMKSKLMKLGKIIALIVPVLVATTASMILWGEEEYPQD